MRFHLQVEVVANYLSVVTVAATNLTSSEGWLESHK